MRKVWVYKRRSVKGWWVGWYENGNRKTKALPSKELAEHFKHIKYTQLNSDVFTGIVAADKSTLIMRPVFGEYYSQQPSLFIAVHERLIVNTHG